MSIVAVAFTPAPAEQNPNLRARAHKSAPDAYYGAMGVTFASAARWGEGHRLCLITDVAPPPAHERALRAMDVEMVLCAFDHRPPAGFHPAFNASLYTIDAMRHMADKYPGERILLLDPDCVAVRPLAPLLEAVTSGEIGAYPTGFPADEVSNGLSALQAERLHRELDPDLTSVPVHYGGECYVFDSASIMPVLARAESGYALSLRNHAAGLDKFVTEEHLLNYGLRYARVRDLSPYVKRIWTAPSLRNVAPSDTNLVVWHLPAEKDRGLEELRSVTENTASWFWTSDGSLFREQLGRRFGIPRRQGPRWLYDVTASAARRVQIKLSAS